MFVRKCCTVPDIQKCVLWLERSLEQLEVLVCRQTADEKSGRPNPFIGERKQSDGDTEKTFKKRLK